MNPYRSAQYPTIDLRSDNLTMKNLHDQSLQHVGNYKLIGYEGHMYMNNGCSWGAAAYIDGNTLVNGITGMRSAYDRDTVRELESGAGVTLFREPWDGLAFPPYLVFEIDSIILNAVVDTDKSIRNMVDKVSRRHGVYPNTWSVLVFNDHDSAYEFKNAAAVKIINLAIRFKSIAKILDHKVNEEGF